MGKRRFFLYAALSLALVAGSAPAAPGDIRTFAGGGVGDGGQARDAYLDTPWSALAAPDGSFLFVDAANHRVRRIRTDGIIETIAGTGSASTSGDGGPAGSASMSWPHDLAIDEDGNLYVAETNAGRIRKIDAATSMISTFAGGGPCCAPPADGSPSTGGYISSPQSVHWSNGALTIGTGLRIYRVADGIITRIGGGTGCTYEGDIRDGGPARDACFSNVYGLTTDASGTLFVSDSYNNRIRRIETGADGVVDGDQDETISTVAGNGERTAPSDTAHPTEQASLYPAGLDFDAAGNLVFAEERRVRRISPGADGLVNGSADERITTLAGDLPLTGIDGTPANAQALRYPRDVDVLDDGRILVADTNMNRIRMIDALGSMRLIAGNATTIGDEGPATKARFSHPSGIARTGDSLYIADTANRRIRRVDASGIITTVAGGGAPVSGNGDGGHPRGATFTTPARIAADAAGTLYVADRGTNRLRKITAGADGVVNGGGDERITTLAGPTVPGSGTAGFFPTQLTVQSVAVAPDDSVYFTGRYDVWRVTAGGSVARVAGTGERGSWGDCNRYSCNPASEAGFNGLNDIAIAGDGRIYVVDSGAGRVRVIVPDDGVIDGGAGEYVYTVAGSCRALSGIIQCTGYAGDGGPATSALLRPGGVSIGADGSLYIADSGNSRVRRVTPDDDGVVDGGDGEIISTIAGSGSTLGGYAGDGGPATAAMLGDPSTVLAGETSLWIADTNNDRIREVSL